MEAENALNHNLNVFMFSDNVVKEDEVRLKNLPMIGLLVMGPDWYGNYSWFTTAFTNTVNQGDIGVTVVQVFKKLQRLSIEKVKETNARYRWT